MDGMTSQMQNTIKNINIQKNKQSDYWHWIPDKNGKFSNNLLGITSGLNTLNLIGLK